MTQQVSVLEPSHRSRQRTLSGGNAFASSPRADAMRFSADIATDRLKLTLVRAGKVSLHVSVPLRDFVPIMETASIDTLGALFDCSRCARAEWRCRRTKSSQSVSRASSD